MPARNKISCPEPKKELEYKFVKYAKLRPGVVIIQNRLIGDLKTQKNENSLLNLDKGKAGNYNGYLSPATTRKLRSIIENFLTAVQLNTTMVFPKSFPSAEVYPTFLTLTLPSKQWHCDNDLKEVFSQFMQYLTGDREKGFSGWKVKNYIWTSETQKNGNLHFHVILDRALPAQRIQQIWNKHLERLGYITRFRNAQEYIYRHGFFVRNDMLKMAVQRYRQFCTKTGKSFRSKEAEKTEKDRQEKAYQKGKNENWNNPPTTKIHAIQSIKKLTAYVSKYMTKAPKVIKPELQQNESFVEENGKFYIESTTETTTFDHLTGENITTFSEPVRQEVTVKFENRYIRGRVWGCSKLLHGDNITPFTVDILAYDRVNTITYSVKALKVSRARYETDLFGKTVYMGMEVNTEYHLETTETSDYVKVDHNADGAKWIEWLEAEHVPKSDIDRCTNMAGSQFVSNGGKIIPLEYQQKDLLQAYSPDLYVQYCEHYTNLFNSLYQIAV